MKCSSCGTWYPDDKIFCLSCGDLLAKSDGQIRLGNYVLLEKIGQGGVGVVYKAQDEKNKRFVALKILNQESFGDITHMQRFRREIRMHSQLKHPNIIEFMGVHEEGDVIVLVMELLSGCNLKEYINHKGALSTGETIDISVAVLSALEVAHKKGIIHRDIKPSNIFLTDDGKVKLMDFGLARTVKISEDITQSGITVGTYMYMAPEQILKQDIGKYTDLYAFGIVLYRMATAILPFMSTGGGEFEIMEKQVRHTPQNPKELNPNIPDAMVLIISRLLAKTPKARPKSCSEVVQQLQELRDSITQETKGEDTLYSDLNTGITHLSGKHSKDAMAEDTANTVGFHTLLSSFSVDALSAPERPPFDMRRPPAINPNTLKHLKQAVATIPPLPEIWYKVQGVFEDATSSPSDLAKVVLQDPVLTAYILKTCNTAAYTPAGAKENTDVALAITRIGMDSAQCLILSEVAPKFDGAKSSTLSVRGIWFHSQAIAMFTKILAEYSQVVDAKSAGMFGLLHDIGKLVILHAETDKKLAVVKKLIDMGEDTLVAELRVLGYSHIDAGMMLALHWKLPRQIHRFIYYHHFPCWQNPETWPPDVQASTMLVQMAHLVLSSLTKGDAYNGVWSKAQRTHVKSSEAILHNPLKLPLKDASLYSNMRVKLKHLQCLFPDLYI